MFAGICTQPAKWLLFLTQGEKAKIHLNKMHKTLVFHLQPWKIRRTHSIGLH